MSPILVVPLDYFAARATRAFMTLQHIRALRRMFFRCGDRPGRATGRRPGAGPEAGNFKPLTAAFPVVRVLPTGASRARPNQNRNPEETMTWNAPVIEEISCGMEINMYFPAEEDGDLF